MTASLKRPIGYRSLRSLNDALFNDELNRSLRSLNDANDELGGRAEGKRGGEGRPYSPLLPHLVVRLVDPDEVMGVVAPTVRLSDKGLLLLLTNLGRAGEYPQIILSLTAHQR